MDLAKLSPAPWTYTKESPGSSVCGYLHDASDEEIAITHLREDDGPFIALARNAFDVILRRGWCAERCVPSGWVVQQDFQGPICLDPFTALVEAEKWYVENVEAVAALPPSV